MDNICVHATNKKVEKNMKIPRHIKEIKRLSEIDKEEINKYGIPCGNFGWKYWGYNANFGETMWCKVRGYSC